MDPEIGTSVKKWSRKVCFSHTDAADVHVLFSPRYALLRIERARPPRSSQRLPRIASCTPLCAPERPRIGNAKDRRRTRSSCRENPVSGAGSPLRSAAGEHVFGGHVDEGREARVGRLRTLLDELVANVNPPAVFVPSVHLDLQRDVCESHAFMKELRAARR